MSKRTKVILTIFVILCTLIAFGIGHFIWRVLLDAKPLSDSESAIYWSVVICTWLFGTVIGSIEIAKSWSEYD